MCPAPYILFGFVCWTSCFVLYYRWCVLLVVHRFVLNKGLQVVVMHILHNVQCSAHPTGVVLCPTITQVCVLDKGLQVVVCIKRAVDHPARHPALPQGGETSRLSSSSPLGRKSFKAESDS